MVACSLDCSFFQFCCPALRLGSRVRVVLGALCLPFYSCNSNDVWRSLRGVPRAFGVTFVRLGLLLASLRVAAAFLTWAVALVSRLVSRAFSHCCVTSRMLRACEMHE
jgi:hypothetical protein